MSFTLARVAVVTLALGAAPAAAATRSFTITSFDRVRIDGAYSVSVTTSSAAVAKATGTPAALDRIRVRVEGTTLIVSTDPGGWGGYPDAPAGPVTLEVGTANLAVATVNGAGALKIDRVRGLEFALNMQGSGSATVAELDVDRFKFGLSGAGTAKIAGRALAMTAIVRGAGSLDATNLQVRDAVIGAEGPAVVGAAVSNSAKVEAAGVAAVTLTGDPGCQVRLTGTATVAGCR